MRPMRSRRVGITNRGSVEWITTSVSSADCGITDCAAAASVGVAGAMTAGFGGGVGDARLSAARALLLQLKATINVPAATRPATAGGWYVDIDRAPQH